MFCLNDTSLPYWCKVTRQIINRQPLKHLSANCDHDLHLYMYICIPELFLAALRTNLNSTLKAHLFLLLSSVVVERGPISGGLSLFSSYVGEGSCKIDVDGGKSAGTGFEGPDSRLSGSSTSMSGGVSWLSPEVLGIEVGVAGGIFSTDYTFCALGPESNWQISILHLHSFLLEGTIRNPLITGKWNFKIYQILSLSKDTESFRQKNLLWFSTSGEVSKEKTWTNQHDLWCF